MESSKILIIGSEFSVFDYNLNKQFLNINKIIITNDNILNSFENEKIKEVFENLSISKDNENSQILNNEYLEDIFQTNLNDEFYKNLQEKLNLLNNDLSQIKLDNYNFMNTVSNSKYTITIRSIGFSKSIYYEEKGQILFTIKNLIKDYLKNKSHLLNPTQIKRFQIEIYESYEVYKNVILKKEDNSILLSSSFGFLKNTPCDFSIGPEFYFSINDDFQFYKNSQSKAILRKQNKLELKEINEQKKVLTNDELILINKITKDIHDASIEIIVNDKGKIKILNISTLENSIYNNSETGFFINKSSKNYTNISLLTFRDNLEEESVNPKYLLLRNEQEICEFLEKINIVKQLDGIILTFNFYNQVLDYIGKKYDIDIIFMNLNLNKNLEVNLDREKVFIENNNLKNNSNPFGAILTNKKEDAYLNKLKNIDLSTPKQEINNYEKEKIENVATSIISSQNSSINKNQNTFTNISSTTENGKKKSAIEILADSVLNPKPKIEPIKEELKPQNNEIDFSQSSLVLDEISSKDLNPICENKDFVDFSSVIDSKENKTQNKSNLDLKKYENILATKIITTPNINSGIYFANLETLPQINSGEIYFLTTSIENLNNPHLNYIVPIEIENIPKNAFILVSSMNDFFLINENKKNDYFISLTQIDENLKNNFLENTIKKLGIINLIITKYDLKLVEKYIDKINSIFIKDLENDNEFNEIKNEILIFEKKKLIRNN